jgi:putative MFS transporter
MRSASLNRQMPLDAFWRGMIDSSAMMGTFLGSLVSGWLSDKPRRKKIFLLSFLSITAAAFAHFYVTSTFELCVLRVLIGFGMGGDFAVGHAILGAEFPPRKHRGTLPGSFSVVWTVGYVVANVLGMQYASAAPDAWRWLLASAGVPALIVLLLRMGTPESPRGCMAKDASQKPRLLCSSTWVQTSRSTVVRMMRVSRASVSERGCASKGTRCNPA